jgi:hypothetical protein
MAYIATYPAPTAANLDALRNIRDALNRLKAGIANYKNVPTDFNTQIDNKIRAVNTAIATASGGATPTTEADIIRLTAEIKATRDEIKKFLPTIANNNIKNAVQNNVIAAAA